MVRGHGNAAAVLSVIIAGALQISWWVGVTLGLIAGYFGGWLDSLIMRFMDLLWAFPEIILAVGMVAVFGAGIRNIIVAVAVAYLVRTWWKTSRGEKGCGGCGSKCGRRQNLVT